MEINEYFSGIKNVSFGSNVTIVHPANIYDCQIGNDTFIGPFTEIQKNVKIGKHCKIQSHTFICELVELDDNVFIGHGVMFVNDKFINGGPARGDKSLWGKTYVGKNTSIGSNSTILPVNICDNVVIGAGSVVTKDIIEPGVYYGIPAKKNDEMIKFLDLKSQYLGIKSEIDEAVLNILSNSAFIGGEELTNFEKNFAEFCETKYCLGVGNGTDALEIAIEALNLPSDSEIIVPANSFIASSEAVTRSGHKVVFCDCDPKNYSISINSVLENISSKTRAIIAVHLYGHPCDMDPILDIAQLHNLKVIEDCSQAHGAKYKDRTVGGIGDVGTFSFYPGKNLGAYGDAGAIVTNNLELITTCKKIANHGRISKYNHEFEGRNSRLDNLQASILNVKLKKLGAWTERRNLIARIYELNLSSLNFIILPKKEEWAYCAYHLFVIRVPENRDDLMSFLKQNDIETGIHYPIALPKLPAYSSKDINYDFFANNTDNQLLSLPIGEHLTEIEVDYIISKIKEYYTIAK